MIKKLRRKFIFSTMAILITLFALVIGALNYAFAQAGKEQTFAFLRQVAQLQAMPAAKAQPSRPADGAPDADRQPALYFSHSASPIYGVYLSQSGDITLLYAMNESAQGDTTEALAAAQRAVALDKQQGTVGRWRFCKAMDGQGNFIALMDTAGGLEAAMLQRLLWTSIAVGLGALIMLYFVCLWLSRFVTKPAEETFNKQKQFISDASHELKTPLSVISLNAEVLSGEIGPNKYMDYIRSEAKRMDGLIHQLLELSRMEDASRPLIKAPFDLSQALFEIALPFESTAFEQKVTYDIDIADRLCYTGEAESIKQLAAILLDNAFHHTPTGGRIKICAKSRGSGAVITVENTGPGICKEDLPHIFERFYRCDKARCRSGGYGLGLAIASSIVTAHGGSICAQSELALTCFTVVL